MLKLKVEPLPSSLSTPILPSIISTSLLVMDSPNPAPSTLLLALSSTWEFSRNIFFMLSFGMPMPVSETANSTSILLSSRLQRTFSVMLPSRVNLTALVSRLVKICFKRNSSPYRLFGRSSGMSRLNFTGFSPRRVRVSVITSFNRLDILYSSGDKEILPDSILERSRTSFTIFKSEVPALFIFSRFSVICLSRCSSSSIKLVSPITTLRGVRSSWLMFARKLLFSRLAASAASFCLSFSSRIFLLSVISINAPATRMALPSLSRTDSPEAR